MSLYLVIYNTTFLIFNVFNNNIYFYLGLPLRTKNPPNSFQNNIIERIHKKLVGQKGKLLSQVDKVQLLKSCLQNISVYYLSLFNMPTFIMRKNEKIERTFLWIGIEEKLELIYSTRRRFVLQRCQGIQGFKD